MSRTLSRAVLATALTASLAAAPLALAAPAHSTPAAGSADARGAAALGGLASRQCFTDPASAGASSSARGAGGHGPDTREISRTEQRQIEARTKKIVADKRRDQSASSAATANSITSVPVYVHVMIGKNDAGNVTDSQITRQLAVLN